MPDSSSIFCSKATIKLTKPKESKLLSSPNNTVSGDLISWESLSFTSFNSSIERYNISIIFSFENTVLFIINLCQSYFLVLCFVYNSYTVLVKIQPIHTWLWINDRYPLKLACLPIPPPRHNYRDILYQTSLSLLDIIYFKNDVK